MNKVWLLIHEFDVLTSNDSGVNVYAFKNEKSAIKRYNELYDIAKKNYPNGDFDSKGNICNIVDDNMGAVEKIYIVEEEIQDLKEEEVVYNSDCCLKANHHLTKYKHWAKVVTSINKRKSGGYCFEGRFINHRGEALVPVGSYVIECCGGSYKLYIVEKNNKVNGFENKKLLLEGKEREFITFLIKCEELI